MISRHRTRVKAAAVAAALAAITLGGYVMAAPVLDIQSNLSLTGQQILLKDIVKIPSILPKDWGNRAIMSSPTPGEPKHYNLTTIAYALQKYPDMQDVVLRGQRHLVMASTGVILAPDEIKTAIEDYISDSKEWTDRELHIEFEPLKKEMNIPTGEQAIEIKSCKAEREDYRYRFTISVSVDGQQEQPLNVYARIVPMVPVWVATKALKKEHSITSQDLTTKLVPEDTVGSHIPITDSLNGYEINRAVRPNQAFSRHYVIEPMCARSGDVVNINAKRGTLNIILRARALSTGRRNDRIICMNEQSNRRLTVRLTGTREATIDF